MDGNALEALLETAIGLVFMWLILSVATMSLQEWIAGFLRWRAKDLETAIRRLLGNQVWAEQLYVHPLIQGLSKKTGVRPAYIPANKFALALYDIVMTAGTEQSFIQQQLLSAKREIENMPDQFVPWAIYLFKRFGNSISGILHHIGYFFGSNRGTGEQKLEELLRLTQKLFVENRSSDLGELHDKLKQFFLAVIDDKTILITGKKMSISSADFLREYPAFAKSVLDMLGIALNNQPDLRLRWAEILVHNNTKLIEKIRKELAEGESLREKLRQMVLDKADNLDLNQENLELVIDAIRQTMDKIDFVPVVNYIQELIGTAQGLDALKRLNPTLYRSLSQLKEDTIGAANTPQILQEVRTHLATAAATLEEEELKLETMRINSETWFNESMDRLSGWYKRKSTLLAFILGLLLAAFLNVDSISLSRHLWKEPAVREALAANATEFSNANTTLPVVTIEDNNPTNVVDYFNAQFQGLDLPLGWNFESVALDPDQICRFLPFGQKVVWGIKDKRGPSENQCIRISNAPANSGEWNLKVLGILFSAFAAAQGSPFWFDILKKIVNVRSSGKNPDEKTKK